MAPGHLGGPWPVPWHTTLSAAHLFSQRRPPGSLSDTSPAELLLHDTRGHRPTRGRHGWERGTCGALEVLGPHWASRTAVRLPAPCGPQPSDRPAEGTVARFPDTPHRPTAFPSCESDSAAPVRTGQASPPLSACPACPLSLSAGPTECSTVYMSSACLPQVCVQTLPAQQGPR